MLYAPGSKLVKSKIVILGAGISGLTSAWGLRKKYPDAEITVIEKEKRVGGWIHSKQVEGHFFELGPRSLRPHGAGVETLKLIKELGLEEEVITPPENSVSRYLWYRNKLRKVPSSLFEFVCSPWIWPAGLGFLKSFCRKKPLEELSVYDYFKKYYGSFAADVVADALVAGIYAGDPKKLSMKACFPNFGKKEKKSSIQAPLFTLKGGLEILTRALFEKLNVKWQLETEVTSIESGGVQTNRGFFEADTIVSALPAHVLDKLTGGVLKTLKKFESLSLGVVSLAWKRNLLPVTGFGYLIPRSEGEKILGTVFDSSTFPFQNQSLSETRVTVMLPLGVDLVGTAKHALCKHLNINEEPHAAHEIKALHAIPQYKIGHKQDVEELEREVKAVFPTLTVTGSSYYGVAVNDCVKVCAKLMTELT